MGQLGVKKENEIIPINIVKNVKFKQISAGSNHFGGLTIENEIFTFGSNYYSQCGGERFNSKFTPIKLKVVEEYNKIITLMLGIFCGSTHSIVKLKNTFWERVNYYSFGANFTTNPCLLFDKNSKTIVQEPTKIELNKIKIKICYKCHISLN